MAILSGIFSECIVKSGLLSAAALGRFRSRLSKEESPQAVKQLAQALYRAGG